MMEYDTTYVPHKAIKDQVFAYFLATHPLPNDSPLVVKLLDEEVFTIDIESQWELYFDGASRTETDPDSETK
jgi:hypothetical protein